MKLSRFGRKFSRETGARLLMDDLGAALAGTRPMHMLGGGNPSHIPAVQERLRARLRRLVDDPAEFARVIGNYDAPQGEREFIHALAALLRREYGWDVGPENIVLTTGSQGGFFALFNMLAGDCEDGLHRRILLPMTPEYVGYADLGLRDDFFTARRPNIELLPDHMFKYHVDFDAIEFDATVSAICVSRPTNPTGNVITNDEVHKLSRLAGAHGVPLILDNAYGMPFPRIIFTDAEPLWNENIVLCMSLSKIGLPAVRTGIVVARPDIVDVLVSINAVLHLATGSIGPALMLDLVRSGEIIDMCRRHVTPYYRSRMEQALAWVHEAMAGSDYRVHVPEGAIFLWLWFPGLPITSAELYRRLKARGVLVLPGHYFFNGIEPGWAHRDECIRVTYSQSPEGVRAGIEVIAEEVRRAFDAPPGGQVRRETAAR
ncbi:MAG: valine--pyruvate transaminase [Gammaproteobacteria bacterium]|nr:valine--pyruvate transaminase [Gammaproteobacteria bacterium]